MATPGLNLEDEDNLAAGDETSTATPATPAKTDTKPAATVVKAQILDDDADFGNEDDYRRPGELDMFKVTEKNTFGRISILINPASGKAFLKKGFVHYVQTKGYARCHSKRDSKRGTITDMAACCKLKEGEPRYGALVVQYLSVDPRTGKFIKDMPFAFEIKACMLSRIGYKEVSTLPNEDGKVTDLDILATPKEDSKGLKYTRFTDQASYTKNPKIQAAVLEAMKPFLDGKELQRKIGKVLTPAEMKVHMGIAAGAEDDGPGMDDLE